MIDGPYALLLVLQILIVSGLLLTLIWLFIYRSRDLAAAAEMELDAHKPAPSPDAAAIASPSAPSPISLVIPAMKDQPIVITGGSDRLIDLTSATVGEFSEAVPAMGLHASNDKPSAAPGDGIMAMQANPHSVPASDHVAGAAAAPAQNAEQAAVDQHMLQTARAETDELKHKIEYLEGKLLEYEIVQEEIASLSSLKVENEKLREEIVQMQRARPAPKPVSEPEPAPAPQAALFSDQPRDTTIFIPEVTRPQETLGEGSEPSIALGAGPSVASEYPPEPNNNVLPFDPSLAKAKQTAEAFQDPATNTQLEKILSKLEQLTTK
jgi:hypothetical protein